MGRKTSNNHRVAEEPVVGGNTSRRLGWWVVTPHKIQAGPRGRTNKDLGVPPDQILTLIEITL